MFKSLFGPVFAKYPIRKLARSKFGHNERSPSKLSEIGPTEHSLLKPAMKIECLQSCEQSKLHYYIAIKNGSIFQKITQAYYFIYNITPRFFSR